MTESVIFTTDKRARDPAHTIAELKPYMNELKTKYLMNPYAPLEDKFCEYDSYRFGDTNLVDNYYEFEKDQKNMEILVNKKAKLQSSFDLQDRAMRMPPVPNKKPLSSIDLPVEEKSELISDYFNNNLTPDESISLERHVLRDFDEMERNYLKSPIPDETYLIKREIRLTTSGAFDYRNYHYNVTSHYEAIAWFSVIVTGFCALISIIQRKEK